MKNIFGLNLLTEEYDGKEFIIRKTDCRITEFQEKRIVQTVDVGKHKKFPVWLTGIQYFCAFAVVLVVFTLIMDMEELALDHIFGGSIWKYITVITAAAVWLSIFIASRVYDRMSEKAPSFKDIYKIIEEEVFDKSYEKLEIPSNADVIDVLSCSINAESTAKPQKHPLYFNVAVRIFTENGNLCLSDLEFVMAIPLKEIVSVAKLKERLKCGNWTKNEEYNSQSYKPYKIRKSKAGEYFIKPCYAVRINHNGEDYEFVVPCYDGATLNKYIGFQP